MVLALGSPSSVAAPFTFCFTSVLGCWRFGHLQGLSILQLVLLVVIESRIGTQCEVGQM